MEFQLEEGRNLEYFRTQPIPQSMKIDEPIYPFHEIKTPHQSITCLQRALNVKLLRSHI